jgi:GNAT superfamily N-acetyltransferase
VTSVFFKEPHWHPTSAGAALFLEGSVAETRGVVQWVFLAFLTVVPVSALTWRLLTLRWQRRFVHLYAIAAPPVPAGEMMTDHPSPAAVHLRSHRPGDIGWVIHRHGVLYAEEYGWDGTFEAMVAKVAAEFIDNFKPEREHCWIAEVDGKIVGSAFVVEQSATIAKLRMVYVEPGSRGQRLGRRLVETAMVFARERGYHRMSLWTNDVLVPARKLYETLGFVMVASEAYRGFGRDLVGETWERDLG